MAKNMFQNASSIARFQPNLVCLRNMSANRRAPGIYGQRPPQWNSPETRLDSDNASKEKRWVRDSDPISDASYFHPTTSEDFKARKAAHNSYKKRDRAFKRSLTAPVVPKRFTEYDEEFAKVTTFESQLQSLKTRGFMRAVKGYSPPADVDDRFAAVCREALPGLESGVDLKAVRLDDDAEKARVLLALERAFGGHAVPNSLLHRIETLDHAFRYYSAPVDTRTPYEKLHAEQERGTLPPNLHVQPRAKRFDPFGEETEGDSDLDRVTAFPGSNTIIVDPENRKRYKDLVWSAEYGGVWRNSAGDDDHKNDENE